MESGFQLACFPSNKHSAAHISDGYKLSRRQVKVLLSVLDDFKPSIAQGQYLLPECHLDIESRVEKLIPVRQELSSLLNDISNGSPIRDDKIHLLIRSLFIFTYYRYELSGFSATCPSVLTVPIDILGQLTLATVLPVLLAKPHGHVFNAGLDCHVYAYPWEGRWNFRPLPGAAGVTHWLSDFAVAGKSLACVARDSENCDSLSVQEGQAVCVTALACKHKLKECRRQYPSFTDRERACVCIRIDFSCEPSDTMIDLFMDLAENCSPPDDVMFAVRQCHGLTRDTPFNKSAELTVLSGKDGRDFVYLACSCFGLTLADMQCDAFLPMAFPPALSDVDRQLQMAHLDLALNSSGDSSHLRDSMACALKDWLEQLLWVLPELSKADLDEVLQGFSTAVQEAARIVHTKEMLLRVAHAVVLQVVDDAHEQAMQNERLKQEWARRESWVASLAQERTRAAQKKRKSKKKSKGADEGMVRLSQSPVIGDVAVAKCKVATAIRAFDLRSQSYARTSEGIAKLESSGLARLEKSTEVSSSLRDACEMQVIHLKVPRGSELGIHDRFRGRTRPPDRQRCANRLGLSEALERDVRDTNERLLRTGIEMSLQTVTTDSDHSTEGLESESKSCGYSLYAQSGSCLTDK